MRRAASVISIALLSAVTSALLIGCWPPLDELTGGTGAIAPDAGRGAGDADARVAYKEAVLADAPLFYWRFGEKPGTVVVSDSSGNGYTGGYGSDCTVGVPGALALDPD